MSGHYIRKRTRTGAVAFAFASFAAMLLVVAVLFFRRGALDLEGLSFSILAVAAMVVLSLLLALVAVGRAWSRGDRGGGRGVAALVLALLLAVPFAVGLSLALEYPNSTMAETDGIAADPAFAPQAAVPASADLLLGREFQATAADVYSASRTSLEAAGWEVVAVEASNLREPAEGDLGVSGTVLVPVPTLRETLEDEAGTAGDEPLDRYEASDSDAYTISAVAFAPILALPSDVTIRIVEVEGVTLVDMRSVSRDLPRDLGQNRRFISGFLSRLEAAVDLLQSGPVED